MNLLIQKITIIILNVKFRKKIMHLLFLLKWSKRQSNQNAEFAVEVGIQLGVTSQYLQKQVVIVVTVAGDCILKEQYN